jgi:hypothetical protein
MKMAVLWRCVDWHEFTDVSEVLTASIIRVMSEAESGRNGRNKGEKSGKARPQPNQRERTGQGSGREPKGEGGGGGAHQPPPVSWYVVHVSDTQ